MTQEIIHLPHSAGGERGQRLELAIRAWLHAKSGRSNSTKTLTAYQDTLTAFQSALHQAGLDLDSEPVSVALVAQVFAGGPHVAPASYNQRLAILSSFYRYSLKSELLSGLVTANPIARVERRKVQSYAGVTALAPQEVKSRLAKINRQDVAGARDYALLMLALTTGRRLSEIAGLVLSDLSRVGSGKLSVHFRRCKGGKEMRDELAAQVCQALLDYLARVYPPDTKRAKDSPVWVSLQKHDGSYGKALSTRSLQIICEKRLGISRFHSLRHTFAHSMEEAGAKVSDIQAKLGHDSLQTTGRYLAALKQAENEHADTLAGLFGSD
jgi:site-specific recombinase XerD